jgi:hypothetical protein
MYDEPIPAQTRPTRPARRLIHLWTRALSALALVTAAGPAASVSALSDEPIILEVASAEVCISVERLKPIEPGRRFSASVGRLYCLSRIGNIEKETQVYHVWYKGAVERSRIALPVNPPSWRTYSWKRILPADVGGWRVDICDAAGNVLKTVPFEVYGQP